MNIMLLFVAIVIIVLLFWIRNLIKLLTRFRRDALVLYYITTILLMIITYRIMKKILAVYIDSFGLVLDNFLCNIDQLSHIILKSTTACKIITK